LVTQTGGSCKLAVAEALGADFDAATSGRQRTLTRTLLPGDLQRISLALALTLALVVVVAGR